MNVLFIFDQESWGQRSMALDNGPENNWKLYCRKNQRLSTEHLLTCFDVLSTRGLDEEKYALKPNLENTNVNELTDRIVANAIGRVSNGSTNDMQLSSLVKLPQVQSILWAAVQESLTRS